MGQGIMIGSEVVIGLEVVRELALSANKKDILLESARTVMGAEMTIEAISIPLETDNNLPPQNVRTGKEVTQDQTHQPKKIKKRVSLVLFRAHHKSDKTEKYHPLTQKVGHLLRTGIRKKEV